MHVFVTKKVPRTLMLCTRSNLLISVFSVEVSDMAEALLMTISMPPNFLMAFATAFCIWSSNLISHCTANALPPAASISAAAENIVPLSFGFSSTLLAAITILAPSFASRRAIALPIPLVAPVMKAVLLMNDIQVLLPVKIRKGLIEVNHVLVILPERQ